MRFDFIHTADLHLDSPMRGLSRYEGVPEETMRSATRDAFIQLIDEAIRRRVAFIVIAGDISDGGWNDVSTGLFFIKQCGRAAAKGIRVFVIWGNHDADSEGARKLTMPDRVHVFEHQKAEQIEIPELQVAVTGQSFGKREEFSDLAAGYPQGKSGYFNVALLHTALDGRPDHAPYAPCNLGTLKARGMDYWALGHVHTGAIVHEDPWVVFPGNLQGRSVRETGARGALLVQVDGGRVIGVDPLEVDVARWASLTIDASGATTIEQVGSLARDAISPLVSDIDDRPMAVRITLTGTSAAHGQMTLRPEEVRNQMRSVAAGLHGGRIWIEKVRVETSPIRTSETIADRGDAVADLQQLLRSGATDPELHAMLRADLELLNKVDADALTSDAAKRPKEERWSELIQALSPGLIEALLSER
ncbi:MAG: DNA repair exonuclease [Nevskia sp.]|nr:DNA repair exonuclease [Nevskia sp.]